MKHKIRLLKATINNVKNVKAGVVNVEKLNESIDGRFGNVVGLYGQNGSGKTSFVDACNILKELMSGHRLKIRNQKNELVNEKYEKYITIDENSMILNYEFYISLEKDFFVNYIVEICKYEDSFQISSETIKCKPLDGSKDLHKVIKIESYDNEFKTTPLHMVNTLKKYNKNAQVDLEVAYELSKTDAQSIVFSDKIINLFSNIPAGLSLPPYADILLALKKYANWELMIVSRKDIGLISMDAFLPLRVRYSADGDLESSTQAVGTIGLRISGNSQIPESVYHIVTKIFSQINIILKEIVPDLSIKLDKTGITANDDKETMIKVKLKSIRKGKEIDFQYESEGIKRIVSILNYMAAMFNSESVCLVVDEFDSGIHEYLLGEILSVLKDRCEGQFIFTSHNLRPLEKLSPENILFTTTNEYKKYIKFKDIKPVQNLRDCYYRAIQLGGQDEKLYEETKSYNIKKAFRLSVREVNDGKN